MLIPGYIHLWPLAKIVGVCLGLVTTFAIYSLDLALPDYFLFTSLQNIFYGKKFNNDDYVKFHLNQFIASKEQKYYKRNNIRVYHKSLHYLHS